MMDQNRIESLKRRYGNRVADSPRKKHGPGRMAARGGGKPKNSKETVKRLLSYLEKDKMWMGAAFLCVIVSTLTNLAGSYMLRPIINTYIVPLDGSRGDSAGLFRALIVMAGIYLLSVAAKLYAVQDYADDSAECAAADQGGAVRKDAEASSSLL